MAQCAAKPTPSSRLTTVLNSRRMSTGNTSNSPILSGHRQGRDSAMGSASPIGLPRSVSRNSRYCAFYAGGKKAVPDVRLEALTLAVWFMDVGCKSHRALYLNTQQFNVVNQHRLIQLLKEQCGIDATLNRDRHYYRLRIAVGRVRGFRTSFRR